MSLTKPTTTEEVALIYDWLFDYSLKLGTYTTAKKTLDIYKNVIYYLNFMLMTTCDNDVAKKKPFLTERQN